MSTEYPLARALSDEGINENHNCICLEFADCNIIDRFMFIRLGCGCVIHYHCLIRYIKFKIIHDRRTISLNGISCPYGTECKLEDESKKKYFITTDDLENIYHYGIENPQVITYLKENDIDLLSYEEVEGLKKWIEEEKLVTTLDISNDDDDLYTIYTTKACPRCNYRSTHYHGHNCHHISPDGGCPNCKVNYCYKCLSSESENIEVRGKKNMCKCGYWSNFCFNLTSLDDIENYIDINEGGIPYDSRCGCVICCDCKRREPCAYCPGDCCVCRGYVNPSPKEVLVEGSEWIRRGPRFNDGEVDEDSDDGENNFGGEYYDEYDGYNEYENAEEVEEEVSENVLNLWEYCRHGLVDDLLNLIDLGLSDEELNMLDRNGRTALYLCCDAGHEDCVRILLQQHGIDCNLYDNHVSNVGPPLLAATCNQFENIVAMLLEHPEIAVNSAGRNSDRSCHRACLNGYDRIVSMLLDHPDIDPWRLDDNRNTCLHKACLSGSLSIVRQLLRHQTCTLEKVKMCYGWYGNGDDALGLAYEGEHDEVVLALLEYPGVDSSNFLVNVLERSRRPTIPATILTVVNVNRPINSSNLTPLLHACTQNKVQLVEKLLSLEGINVNCLSSSDETPLLCAANRGVVLIVEMLLNHPQIDPNCVSKSGMLPLLSCIRSRSSHVNFVAISELLLKHPRIDLSVNLAMSTACQRGFTDVVRLLLAYPSTNVNKVDEDGISYLHYACFYGHKEIVELLLEHEAIDVFIKTSNGNTPLNFSVKKGRDEITQLLIRHPQFDPSTMIIPSR